MSWKSALAPYSEEEVAQLEQAALSNFARIEKAAHDLTCTGVVDGIDISEIWFAVLRRREELEERVPPALADKPVSDQAEPVEAPEEPVEAEDVEAAPEPEAVVEEAPVEEAPKPKPRARKSA